MKYVLIGKLVNTHGLKGEVRILSNFKYKDKVFIPGMRIYIGKDKTPEEIVSYRHHKIFEMIMMKGYNYIDEVLKYKGEYVFVNREDIKLDKDTYLDEDIIGCDVYFDKRLLGKVVRIDNHNGNYVLLVRGEREYLIPYVMMDKVDINKKEIKTKDITGLV